MKAKTRIIVILTVLAVMLAGCTSLKPFTDDDFRHMGVTVPESAAK